MTRKIFRSILLVAGVVLAAGMVIMYGLSGAPSGGAVPPDVDRLRRPGAV